MNKLPINITNNSPFELPKYQTEQSAGLDLQANILQPLTLGPLERALIPTGLSIELPQGYEAQIRPRSGLAFKKGLTVLNTPGTIDADYRGDVGVLLVNLSNDVVTIEPAERIAQMVIAKHETVEFELVVELNETKRGAGGFGSTGTK